MNRHLIPDLAPNRRASVLDCGAARRFAAPSMSPGAPTLTTPPIPPRRATKNNRSRHSCPNPTKRRTAPQSKTLSRHPGIRHFLLALAISLPASFTSPADAATPPSPAQQYKALLKDYNAVTARIRAAETDLQRKEIVGELAPHAAKFVTLAREHPDDPVALTALKQAIQVMGNTDSAATRAWETNSEHFPGETNPDLAEEIVDLVVRDHLNAKALVWSSRRSSRPRNPAPTGRSRPWPPSGTPPF